MEPISKLEIRRPECAFAPSIWGDRFISFSLDDSAYESHHKQLEILKELVRNMLMASTVDPVENIIFIDTLGRLGILYHFQVEITAQLEHASQELNIDANDYDLSTIALVFRVLRQHGYNISCNVLSKFMDDDGKFKEAFKGDAQGILSLFEAAHVRQNGDDILEEALSFTMNHLENIASQSKPHLKKHIRNALKRPYHKGIERIEARGYISFYEDDGPHNEILLQFAKLDFNVLQFLYLEELRQVSKWYKDLNHTSQLPYARDRVVECYFWALGTCFEPQFSRARVRTTKAVVITSFLDDTYDTYGTIQELTLFTDAIQRWEPRAIGALPNYMKFLYEIILKVYDDFEIEMSKEGRSYAASYAKNALKELVEKYDEQANWIDKDYVPEFEEYLRLGSITSIYRAQLNVAFMDFADIEVFQWLNRGPKILAAAEKQIRLMNDMVSCERENTIQNLTSSVQCYMKQHGIGQEKAIEDIQEMVENCWKDINDELKSVEVSKPILKIILNQGRTTDVYYKHEDGYTNQGVKDHIESVLINSIPI